MRVPLFALNTVLFPGGVLPLRVFEARYMDMVRGCMKSESPFGVVLIRRGKEVGAAAETEAIGTLARIVAWDMPQLGVLHIRTIGGARFHVESSEVQPDGLRIADAELIDDDDDGPIAEPHQPCVALLQRLLDGLVQDGSEETGGDALQGPAVERPWRLDSAVWVSNRLAEFLPVSIAVRQKLMQLPDAQARLGLIADFLRQHGAIE
jgi:uncharacterized protein